MIRTLRHLLVGLTTFAVFVVGSTCTASGCLLSSVGSSPSAKVMSCCMGHHENGPAQPDRHSKSCPVCNRLLVINPTITKTLDHLKIERAIVPLAVLPLQFMTATVPGFEQARSRAMDLPPPVEPSTLLSLFCAFLT